METLTNFTDFAAHVGNFSGGKLVLVVGNLSLHFYKAFTEAIFRICPSAVIMGDEFFKIEKVHPLRKLKALAKAENRLYVFMHNVGERAVGPLQLSSIRSTVGDCDSDLILFVETKTPPFRIHVGKNRSGNCGTMLVSELLPE